MVNCFDFKNENKEKLDFELLPSLKITILASTQAGPLVRPPLILCIEELLCQIWCNICSQTFINLSSGLFIWQSECDVNSVWISYFTIRSMRYIFYFLAVFHSFFLNLQVMLFDIKANKWRELFLTILLPRVRVLSTTSTILSFIVIFLLYAFVT